MSRTPEPTGTVPLSTRLDPKTKAGLERIAKLRRWSLSQTASIVLADALGEDKETSQGLSRPVS